MADADYLCAPSKSWLDRYEELADRSYPTIVVDDVVEPYRPPVTSTPYRSQGEHKGVRFDTSAMQREEYDLDTQRSRSPGGSHRTVEDAEVTDINRTGRQSPYRSRSGAESIEDIVQRYSPTKQLPYDDTLPSKDHLPTTTPPPLRSQMTYSPYRGPIQDEIHTQPYYGPIVNTIRTDFNEPDPVVTKGQGSGRAAAIINKVHNKVSDERVEELSNRYRERMSGRLKGQAKHQRSRSDNTVNDLEEVSRSRSQNVIHESRMNRKLENAMLQIEKLESQIKCLKMEVNSLTAGKKQAEMRVSNHSTITGVLYITYTVLLIFLIIFKSCCH